MKGEIVALDEKAQLEALKRVLANIDDESKIGDLLDDMFTYKEVRDAASRLEVAKLLSEGKSYTEIEKLTGASATTIARVSKCLNRGSGGYKEALRFL